MLEKTAMVFLHDFRVVDRHSQREVNVGSQSMDFLHTDGSVLGGDLKLTMGLRKVTRSFIWGIMGWVSL